MMRQIPFDKTRTYLEQRSLDLTAAFQKCDFFTATNITETLAKLCRKMLRNIIENLEKHVAKHVAKHY